MLHAGALAAALLLQQPIEPDSVMRLVDVPGLARLDPDATVGQFASTDPTGRGEDHGHFLALDGKHAVLAEMEGPGVITRIWSANPAGRLRIFFDEETEPRIDVPFPQLFDGSYEPFAPPIATHEGGGFVSYYPIAYRKHCRVELDELEDPSALYYQVSYKSYSRSTRLHTFTRDLSREETWALRKILEIWRDPPTGPPPAGARAALDLDEVRSHFYFQPEHAVRGLTVGFVAKPGETVSTIKAKRGPGVLRYLGLKLADPTPEVLRGLVLEITVDGARGPSVSVPVGDFFGVGFGPTPVRGLLAGWTEDGGYFRMPMPWQQTIEVAWRNTTEQDVIGSVELSAADEPELPGDFGCFHAEFRATDGVGDESYELARIDSGGLGRLVGVNLTLQGVGDLWYLEGNERLVVDGVTAIFGTGTEDFANGGWYWNSGPFSQPLYGLGLKEEWTTNRTTPWRHFLADSVPFRSSLLFELEHGSGNQVRDAYYSSVAFWYAESPSEVRRVEIHEARIPRQWVPRPPGSIAAVAMKVSSGAAPVAWEEISPGHRGSAHSLRQSFPRSGFERDGPPVDGRVVLTLDRELRATFTIEEGDRYRLRPQIARRPGGPLLDVIIDGRSLGTVDAAAERVEPFLMPALEPIGLERGTHEIRLRRVGRGDDGAVDDEHDWIGLDCLALESAAPFVKSWWLSPPIECDAAATVEEEPAIETTFRVATFDPAAAGWKEVTSEGDGIQLGPLLEAKSAPVCAYLVAFVHSRDERVARVRLGSDDGVRVWCNGELAWSNAVGRGLVPDADRFDVTLRAGWNALLVKVRNEQGGHSLALRIADPDEGLRTATRRE